jgi:Fe-S oxidoreductase
MRVLRAAGRAVEIARSPAAAARPLFSGRTFLAAGLIELAKAEAARLVEALAPAARRGAAIVGLEPSCLYALRDEIPSLLRSAEAEEVAKRAVTFEEYLAAEKAAGRLALGLGPIAAKRALLHGHCHQKAFAGMGAVEAALRLVPGLVVETVESSCCGMAGAFGYEAEHFDASMAMGELSLLPAVRRAGADDIVVADGTSCRHQIREATGRDAVHVARVLARALAKAP